MSLNTQSHWRDSGRIPKMFGIDARAFIPIVICLFHFKLWILIACIFFALFLAILSYKKISLVVFVRIVRNLIAGKKKYWVTRL